MGALPAAARKKLVRDPELSDFYDLDVSLNSRELAPIEANGRSQGRIRYMYPYYITTNQISSVGLTRRGREVCFFNALPRTEPN